MSLLEVVANSATPGTPVALTTLSGNGGSITSGATTMLTAGAPLAALQGAGNQFRIVVDSEIMVASYSSGTWTLTRGAEGSTAASHTDGTNVWHYLTAGALSGLVYQPRQSFSYSTSSIASGASENDSVTLYKTGSVLSLATNRAARVRAYPTSAYRTADASRPVGTDPTGDSGLLLEVVTTATQLSFSMTPVPVLYNEDGTVVTTIYFATQNLDTGTGVVTTTLVMLQDE